MEIEAGDDILRKAAQDGSMDYAAWPDLLPTVLARIEKIAHTEFPIPAIATPVPPAQPPSPRFLAPLPSSDPVEALDQTNPSPTSSQGTDKENAKPSSPSAARNAGTSTNAGPASSTTAAPSSQSGASAQQQPPGTAPLPKPIVDMLDEVLSVLRTNFSQYPPHTIQRLAELVLRPREHYRNVVPYLHALDRVVHVTSGANTYPLPPALPDIGAMSLLANGVGGRGAGGLGIDTAAANNLGSDEALGGALLTPIPWLSRRANGEGSDDGSDAGSSSPLSAGGNPSQQFQLQQHQQRQNAHLEGRIQTENTVTIEGPNGMGSIETVSVSVNGIPSTGAGAAMLTQRSVTQGELLRQEQRAGVVPLNQLNRHQPQQRSTRSDSSDTVDEDAAMSDDTAEEEEEEEIPHARGPEEIGPADTGPQDPATANYIAGGGGSLDVGRLDLEAAVGRRVQSPPAQQQQEGSKRASGSPDGEIIPRSPKREATDKLEAAIPRKRIKEDESPSSTRNSGEGQEQGREGTTAQQQQQQLSDDNATLGDAEADPEPKRDAEGDVVLSDAAAEPTGEDKQTAGDLSASKSEAATKDEGGDMNEEGGNTKTEQTAATTAESGPGSQGG
ncbi:hypothetical protein C8A03DRAFT_29980 [Achaetomium macrosporum]|uniref:Protein phosphatase 4 core regulatory subunit R2 n=1 Tax=Achaetomium macrosporum TaxID=79813 RepID=A0AAN7CGU9_9PEZI|nr:hypothetical protein C8A03DRAFT_29980 [Achaetomium macrosporum]